MLKAAKIVLNLSKFPDSSSKNPSQVNLLEEFVILPSKMKIVAIPEKYLLMN